jgi:hypothetical protein
MLKNNYYKIGGLLTLVIIVVFAFQNCGEMKNMSSDAINNNLLNLASPEGELRDPEPPEIEDPQNPQSTNVGGIAVREGGISYNTGRTTLYYEYCPIASGMEVTNIDVKLFIDGVESRIVNSATPIPSSVCGQVQNRNINTMRLTVILPLVTLAETRKNYRLNVKLNNAQADIYNSVYPTDPNYNYDASAFISVCQFAFCQSTLSKRNGPARLIINAIEDVFYDAQSATYFTRGSSCFAVVDSQGNHGCTPSAYVTSLTLFSSPYSLEVYRLLNSTNVSELSRYHLNTKVINLSALPVGDYAIFYKPSGKDVVRYDFTITN